MKPRMTPAALAALANGDIDNAAIAATPGGIEAQEAAGQATFCAQEILPKDHGDREAYEALGFRFGEDYDDIFVNASLPSGWAKRATDHSMWSDIVDENGTVRARVFYKAAFYDRRAFMLLVD